MRKGSGRDWHELVVGTYPDCTAGFPRHPDHQCLPSRLRPVWHLLCAGPLSNRDFLPKALFHRVSSWPQKGIVSSCGDKISSCRKHVQVENSHPRVENSHPQEARARLSFPVATRFHLVEGMCKLKTRTHGLKTRTHKKLGPGSLSLWRQDFIVSLVATRFHLVEGMCKLKTRTHKKLGARLSFPVATRFPSCLLWRQDFILSKACAS